MPRQITDATHRRLVGQIRQIAGSYGYSFDGDSTLSTSSNVYDIKLGVFRDVSHGTFRDRYCIVSFLPPKNRARQMETELLNLYV